METNDELEVERQKLVPIETEEEPTITVPQSATKSVATPASPVAMPKINIKSISSGDTTRSRNSASCSIERCTTSDKGQASSKVMYVNERRPHLHGSGSGGVDERFEFKSRPRKLLKDTLKQNGSVHSLNSITQLDDPTEEVELSSSTNNNNNTNINNKNKNENNNENQPQTIGHKPSSVDTNAALPPVLNTCDHSCSDKFDDRPIKHHSFVSEVPDVKHMERALLGLLEDFHSGKLKAFGPGNMDQMTKIREQQESLAKLHFELAAAEEDSLENGKDLHAAKAQENMLQLVQRLEQLSISIEKLQTSHTGL